MKSFLLGCLVLALVMAQVAFAEEVETATEQNLIEIESKIDENQNKREENLKALKANQADIAEIMSQKLTLEFIIYQTEIDILEQEADLQLVQRDLAKAKADLEQHFKDFGERLRVIYLRPEEDVKLKVLLTSKNFSEFLGRMMYVDAIIEEDQRIITLLKDKQAQIKQLEEAEAAKLAQLTDLMELLDQDHQKLLAVETELSQRGDELKAFQAQLEKEAVELAASSKKIRQELQGMTDEALKIAASQYGADISFSLDDYSKTGAMIAISQDEITIPLSDWIWPTPDTGFITSLFGNRLDPISNKPAFHQGIDIAGPLKTPILAASSGIVTHAGWFSNGYGYAVIIAHGGGYTSVYAHGEEIRTEVGTIVEAGDEIMLMGSTGYSTGSHLHFELIHKGDLIDPLSLVSYDGIQP